jgi:hypothetical protein
LGFLEHYWGDKLQRFGGMEPTPVFAYSVPAPPATFVYQKTVSPGNYVFAEYGKRGGQWIQASGAYLDPLTYMFCWFGHDRLPPQLKPEMRLCGVRMKFHSETADPDTNYDRILALLIRFHGYPQGYDPSRSRITSPNEPEGIAQRPPFDKGRFRDWRWCPIKGEDKAPRCVAAVVLMFDPATRSGEVVYATPLLYAFAWARHWNGAKDNNIWATLGGYSYEPNYVCTGTNLCRPPPPRPLSKKELRQFVLNQENVEDHD